MDCDVLIIGSGPGGYRAAVLAALRGQKTVIVEKGVWGGCCLNRGCVPKKDWYHSARLLAAASNFAGRGLTLAGPLTGDLSGAWRHQRDVVATVRDSYRQYLKRLGVVAVSGHATFTGPHSVMLTPGGERIDARSVVIATGSEPAVPEGVTLVSGKILHTDMLFEEPLPAGRRVAIVGGGVAALEMAYILGRFGCEVRWIARRDPFARKDFSVPALTLLRKSLAEAGLEPHLASLARLAPAGEGVRLTTQAGETLEADWALLATGRKPVTAGLGLDAIGVACDERGFVTVDETLATTVPGVFALGDCTPGPMTANRALFEAGVVIDNIMHGVGRTRDSAWVPEVIYSAVELARVGLTEEQAEDADREPAVGFAAFETSPRALGQDETEGYVRLVVDLDSAELLGGEVVGGEAGELIHMMAAAPRANALRDLARRAYNHPSRTEEFQNAVETLIAKWKLADRVFADDNSA